MCLYPRLIKNRKYTLNKKNGGNIPQVKDDRTLLVPVGCGNCVECRKQKARGWQIRMLEEVKERRDGKFITLTFSNESIIEIGKKIKGLSGYELDNAIATKGMRMFLERWRKKYKKSLRHWMVTELGHNGTENIHMHGIVWTDKDVEEIRERWGYGYMYPRNEDEKKQNYVSARTVNYIIKYITKRDIKHSTYKSIILTSAGIGGKYVDRIDAERNKYKGIETNEAYRTDSGHKMSLPVYWRNKIYTEEEREQLWLNRLDKKEMYVMGNKIDVSEGYEIYDEMQKYYRTINEKDGYGSEEKTEEWYERRRYENERRKLMQSERMKDPYGTKKKKKEREDKILEIMGGGIIMKQNE